MWLASMGRALVRAETPQKADAILVLAGDWNGGRVMTGCELSRRGYAPVVLVSGPNAWYGLNEADASIQFAARNGCPTDRLEPVKLTAHSTDEEARVLKPMLERRGIRSLLIVTSNYHTNRAGRTFERVLGDAVEVRMIASPDPYFEPSSWWKSREGQKVMFYEAVKNVADWFGV